MSSICARPASTQCATRRQEQGCKASATHRLSSRRKVARHVRNGRSATGVRCNVNKVRGVMKAHGVLDASTTPDVLEARHVFWARSVLEAILNTRARHIAHAWSNGVLDANLNAVGPRVAISSMREIPSTRGRHRKQRKRQGSSLDRLDHGLVVLQASLAYFGVGQFSGTSGGPSLSGNFTRGVGNLSPKS